MFPIIRIVIGIGLIALASSIVPLLALFLPISPEPPDFLLEGLYTLLSVGAALVAYFAFVRIIERRPVTELGAYGLLTELGQGTLVGVCLLTAVIGVLWLLGYYQVVSANNIQSMLPFFFISVSSGVIEELMIRGIVFRIVEEYLGSWWALALSALLFGFLHGANPNATWFSSLAIALEAGILLGAAYMVTRRLWMVIGIHFAWNFTQGGIFGVAVSGYDLGGWLESELSGSTLLSGGEFGVEASIFAVFICTALGLYYVRRAVVRQHIIAPIWKRRSL